MLKSKITLSCVSGKLDVYYNGLGYSVIYITDVIESISREGLKKIHETLGHENIKLYTNAGVDIHSSSDDKFNIKIFRISYDVVENIIRSIKMRSIL